MTTDLTARATSGSRACAALRRASGAILAAALCLSAVGCVESPRVRLHHANIQGVSLAGAIVDVVIEVHNPNAYDIELRDVTAETTFAGRYPLPPIVLHPHQWLPSGKAALVHIPTLLPWLMIPPMLAETVMAPRLIYTVRGSANVTATRTFGIEKDNYPINLVGEMPRQLIVNVSGGRVSF